MKRSALVLLTAIYLLSCVGIGVDRFYCCGKLASTTFTYAPANDNAGTQTPKKNNCCRNEKQSLKIKDNHISGDAFIAGHPLPVIIPSFFCPNNKIALTLSHTNISYNGNAPPGLPDVPVYTLNCTYRI